MDEKMLVARALGERELLVKQIYDRIKKARFVDIVEKRTDRVQQEHVQEQEFSRQAEEDYQKILEMIRRYDQLNNAILESDASAQVVTDQGTFSVLQSLGLQSRLLGTGYYEEDGQFENNLCHKIEEEYRQSMRQLGDYRSAGRCMNAGAGETVGNGRESETVGDFRLVDPLDIRKRAEQIMEKKDRLMLELDTQIRVSNATTYIAVEERAGM